MEQPTVNVSVKEPSFYKDIRERYHNEPLTRIARSLGLTYKSAWYHANKMGLRKERPNGYKSLARNIVRDNYHDHSISELQLMAKASRTTVVNIIHELGFSRTPEERRAISSRVHKKTVEMERIRASWGLRRKTRLKVFANHRKTTLRNTLIRFGYIPDEDDRDILYYDTDTKRRPVREEHGTKMGLEFKPLPEDYWDEDDEYEDDEDYDDDNNGNDDYDSDDYGEDAMAVV